MTDALLSVDDRGPWPTCPAPFNLARHVLTAGIAQPDRVALILAGPAGAERISYARLIAAVRGTATGFLTRGLVPGDRVLMRLGNSIAFPIAFLGALTAGLVPVPTAAGLTPAEIAPLAARVAPRLIVAAPGLALPEPLPCPVLAEADLLAMETLPPADWQMGDPDRAAYVVFTSGTTGGPLAVLHAHRAIWARGMMRAGWDGMGPQDRVLHAGALNWTYTLGTGLMDPWTQGATALIPAPGTATAQLPLLMKRFDATLFAAVPGVYRQLLRSTLPTLPRLRASLSAGERLPEASRRAWEQATGRPLHEAFGLSECSTFLSGSDALAAAPGHAGRAQPGRHIAVLDDKGDPVPRGQDGALAVHSGDPGLMLGYIDAPEAAAARRRGPWFLTGDRARMDATGMVAILGRSDDLITAGGFRISPTEVEEALTGAPGVTDLAVAEVTLSSGATTIACFYTAPDTVDEAALLSRAEATLAPWKRPRLCIRLDLLPRTANGKLIRRALPALAAGRLP